MTNPLITTSQLPFCAIDFSNITEDGIKDAITQGISAENQEISNITRNPDSPTFANTLLPLEHSGKLLERALTVMDILLSNASTDSLEEMAQEISPKITEHYNNINFNTALFNRIKAVKETHPRLTNEEQRLLDETYEGFLRRGVGLDEDKKKRLRNVSVDLNQISLKFSKNVLDDTNRFLFVTKDKTELEGLPPHHLESAEQTAREKGKAGWAFTLQSPSFRPLLTYCKNRAVRKKIWLAYNRIGCKNNQFDNRELVRKLVNLRLEKAQLLGFSCYADWVLSKRMAATKEKVYTFLEELVCKYKPQAKKENQELTTFARHIEGENFKMKPWDKGYYSHLLQRKKYNLNPERFRPYFELSRVIDGVFGLARTLYGITFKQNPSLPVWNKDVKVYEVYDKDLSFLALLYADFHPRANKKSGAWTFGIKGQYYAEDGTNERPHVGITMNFTKPTAKKPALLSLDEVTTFLHEFGHALHEIFSNVRFESQSGTNVYWDFVELPSQFMENYALEKQFLKTFAVHYKTGVPLPDKMIDQVLNSRNFQVATSCLRQLSFGLLDMAYYTLTKPLEGDIVEFERNAWKKAILQEQKLKVCMSTQFQHIMTGGYAAGYYSYKWAEVLDADAFSLFQATGVFNPETARKFRTNILEKGSTQDPNTLYRNFRGKDASMDALLQRDGLIQKL